MVRHDGHSSCGLVLLASFEPRRDMNPGPADASFESQPEHTEQQALQEPTDPGSDDATSTSSASPQILHEARRSVRGAWHHPSVSDAVWSKLERVQDERTFLHFLEALAADRAAEVREELASPSSQWGPGSRGWENTTIESFLGAALTWASASQGGLEFYSVPENPWRRCADIIYMGKIYE